MCAADFLFPVLFSLHCRLLLFVADASVPHSFVSISLSHNIHSMVLRLKSVTDHLYFIFMSTKVQCSVPCHAVPFLVNGLLTVCLNTLFITFKRSIHFFYAMTFHYYYFVWIVSSFCCVFRSPHPHRVSSHLISLYRPQLLLYGISCQNTK